MQGGTVSVINNNSISSTNKTQWSTCALKHPGWSISYERISLLMLCPGTELQWNSNIPTQCCPGILTALLTPEAYGYFGVDSKNSL